MPHAGRPITGVMPRRLLLAVLAGVLAAPAGASAATPRTVDADRDGHLDGVRGAGRVEGYRLLSRTGGRAVLAERAAADTGARPWVRTPSGRRVRARDGAPPVLLHAAERGGRLVLTFSEPVHLAGRRFATRVTVPRRTALRRLRDRAGLRAIPRPTAVETPATIPGARDDTAAAPRRPASTVPSAPAPAPGTPSADPVPGPGQSAPPPAPVPEDDGGWHVLEDPIQPRQQTALAFCDRSHWLQPWRAYLETSPAAALRDALGINLNVGAADFTRTVELLSGAGFRRARVELGWDTMDPADPSRLRDRAGIVAGARTLREHGIRPLVLLNANHGSPGPIVRGRLTVVAPALAGARSVQLDSASRALVVPGRTGFDAGGKAAAVLITAVDALGRATLSRPLPAAVLPGAHDASLLPFEPFARPRTGGGAPNPRFETTLAGWLQYVRAVTDAVREGVGSDAFDVEVWNELSFGSDFLDAGTYYDPLPAELGGTGDVQRTLLERTVSTLRDPANGVTGVGISDGFASQTPFPSGATSPPGLTALSKHPYTGPRQDFTGDEPHTASCRPLDALGNVVGSLVGSLWRDLFTPSYVSYFPEYYLNAIQTEHLVRDVSPLTTDVYGTPHGRATGREVWVTETNIDPTMAPWMGAADRRRMQAKATMRTLVSFVGAGVSAIDFYAAAGEDFGLISPTFWGGGEAGPAIDALGRMTARLGDGSASGRTLTLRSIADRGERVQVRGDGSPGRPSLYDRDLVAAFPFQTGAHRFVVPAYVMTRDLGRWYGSGYDLPPGRVRLELGGVDGAATTVSAYDPLAGETVPAKVVARTADSVTIEVALTDSPRLIELDDHRS